jgi:hypothetical protein
MVRVLLLYRPPPFHGLLLSKASLLYSFHSIFSMSVAVVFQGVVTRLFSVFSAHRDKTFEGAAIALYRQKNFFNRWKSKSSPLAATPRYPPPSGSGRGSVHNKHEVIALNHSYSPASRRTDLRDLNDSMEIHHQREQQPRSSHTGVQTSPDLLDNYVVGLRKRNRSHRSIASLQSLEEMRDARQSAAAARIQQDMSPGHRSQNDITPTQDCLIRPAKLQYTDQSPLLASYEHSPLLSRDASFPAPGSTTSEETLSDPEDTLNDIEELLSGACPHEGSFASLCTDSPVQVYPYKRPQSLAYGLRTSVEPGERSSKPTSPCSPVALTLPSSVIPRIDIQLASPCPNDSRRNSGTSGKNSPPNVTTNVSSSGQTNSSSKVPNSVTARVEMHTSPNVPNNASTSGQMNASSKVPNHVSTTVQMHTSPNPQSSSSNANSQAPTTARPNTISTDTSPHTSSLPQSLKSSPRSSQSSSPPPDPSDTCYNGQEDGEDDGGNRDANSVSKFQAYLRSKGIELDITSVQSSDV